MKNTDPVGGNPRIAHWRLRAGFTTYDVEDIISLPRGVLMKYENGTCLPSRDIAERLALLYQDPDITGDLVLDAVRIAKREGVTTDELEKLIQIMRTLIDIVQGEYDEIHEENQVDMNDWRDAIRAGRAAIAKLETSTEPP